MNFKSTTALLVGSGALVGLLIGALGVILGEKRNSPNPIPYPPPLCPFENCIAAVGCIQPLRDELWIGVPFAEVIQDVYVQEGDVIPKGGRLFSLCTTALEAKKNQAKAAFTTALAEYSLQLSLPRAETIPPLEAALEAANAEYEDSLKHYELYKNVDEPKAISLDELNQRMWAAIAAKFRKEHARANLELVESGAWVKDIEIARARVIEAKAWIDAVEIEIARAIIRAPCDGEVLQININEGEAVSGTTVLTQPHIRFGDTHRFRILVNIDEEQIWRVIKGAKARAFARGNSSIYVDLDFNRIQPLVVPKQAIANQPKELVDVRVLQVIYEFDRNDLPFYVGELVDVYLEGKPDEIT